MLLSEMAERDPGFESVLGEHIKRSDGKPPDKVKGVGRLERDLRSLLKLMKTEKLPLRLVRGKRLAQVIYGFGDASGAGFGSSWKSKRGINYRLGIWGRDMDGKSSNYRELRNLVETVESIC